MKKPQRPLPSFLQGIIPIVSLHSKDEKRKRMPNSVTEPRTSSANSAHKDRVRTVPLKNLVRPRPPQTQVAARTVKGTAEPKHGNSTCLVSEIAELFKT